MALKVEDSTVVEIELERLGALAKILGSLDSNFLFFDVCLSQFSHLLASNVLGTDTPCLVFVWLFFHILLTFNICYALANKL